MMRRLGFVSLLAAALFAAVACGGGGGGTGGEGGGGDLLSTIKERGVLNASTDPAYPPQSFQTPTGEFKGFDIDVTKEIAKRLGVDVIF